jgi:hypothetical protein
METSKKIILASYIISIILTIIVIIGTFMNYDVSNITTIASLSYAELSFSNVWYFKKAAKENVPKIIGSLPEEVREQIDINQLLNE